MICYIKVSRGPGVFNCCLSTCARVSLLKWKWLVMKAKGRAQGDPAGQKSCVDGGS